MTTNNWKEQFTKDYTTKVFQGDSLEENTKNSLAYFTDFIETQIAQARREMKKECIKAIAETLESEKYSKSYYVYGLKLARNSISSL